MISDMDNLDVMFGSGSSNPIESEFADAIEQSSVREDIEANMHQRGGCRDFTHENDSLGTNDVRQSFETFSIEFIFRLSQEMDSMMSMMHNQIA